MADAIISRKDASRQGLRFFFTGLKCRSGHIAKRYVITSACVDCTKERRRRDKQERDAASRGGFVDQPSGLISRKEAKVRGFKCYFTGKACVRGHVAQRWVSSNGCRECADENNAAKYAANRESEKKRMRKRYWEKAREQALVYAKDYYKKNREMLILKARKYREKNPQYAASYGKVYWAQNRERLLKVNKEWIAKNPEKRKVIKRNREARKHWNGGTHTADDVVAILKAQRHRCAYCKKSIKNNYVIDHIVPLARGGSNDRTNIQATCPSCNQRKHARDPLDFARSLGMLL